MSTQLTLPEKLMFSAEMMGVANTGAPSAKASLARLTQIHQATMGVSSGRSLIVS